LAAFGDLGVNNCAPLRSGSFARGLLRQTPPNAAKGENGS
jgi:hypothetical protein